MTSKNLPTKTPSSNMDRRQVVKAGYASIAAALASMIATQKAFAADVDRRVALQLLEPLLDSWQADGCMRFDARDEEGEVQCSTITFRMSENDADEVVAIMRSEATNYRHSNL